MRLILPSLMCLALVACGGGEPTPTETEETETVVPVGDGLPEAIDNETKGAWAVAAAHPLATKAGARILAEGGSAVDAAIAVQTVLGLVEPQSSGLGGGGFMLFYDAQAGKITAYDGREAAPFSAEPGMFLKADGTPMSYQEARLTGRAVGVPATVALLDLAHREHGRLAWGDLFDDAIALATEGFPVPARMASALDYYSDVLAKDEMAASLYFNEDGTTLAEGTLFVNAPYAEAVTAIAEGGAGAFYSGDIAEEIVASVNRRAGPGTMTLEDISSYEAVPRAPVCGGFVGYKICTMSPPSSALAMLQTLGMLEAHGLPAEPTPELWASYGEAGRLAYADRAQFVGDPIAMSTADLSAEDIAEALVAPDYLAERAQLIGDRAAPSVEAGTPLADMGQDRAADMSEEVPGTSHFSIRDSYGNIVSMTGTVEGAFGSYIMAGGMFLNNELTDFSFEPEIDGEVVVNAIGFGKRPRSSMTPTIVLDAETGEPVAAIGSAGGANIIGHVTKTLLLALGYDMPWQEAIAAPHVTTRTNVVYLEDTAPTDVRQALEDYGHNLTVRELSSSLHGFRLDHGKIEGGADPRREGTFETGQ